MAAALGALIVLLLAHVVWGSDAELYFSRDKNGEDRVTKVREGDEIWIVVYDPDEDIDCDVRDKVWTDIKVMDIKTGAHIVWKSYKTESGDANGNPHGDPEYTPYKGRWPGATAGWLGADYLEETGASTGRFVSSRPFQIGTRIAFTSDGRDHAHIVGPYDGKAPGPVTPTDFEWGGYLYADGDGDGIGDDRIWVDSRQEFVPATTTDSGAPKGAAYLPPGDAGTAGEDYMLGRFSNMDTLVGLYVDPNDPSDVALAQLKIIDTKSTIAWDREVYKDGREAATIRIVDPDENLNCNAVERVPVFILVNPGSWNPPLPSQAAGEEYNHLSATNFCALKRYGGVTDIGGTVDPMPLMWYNFYDSGRSIDLKADGSNQPNAQGTYYVQYPTRNAGNVTWFDTASTSGVTRVMFYAVETGANTGVFELNLNSLLTDLGFRHLNVRDVLVAYYVDPNDQDDFSLATAYIGERQHSRLRFTNHAREDQDVFWIGRDPVYVEVVDANANTDACCPEKVVVHVCNPHEVSDSEWLILDEMSSNSSVFFTHIGMKLAPVWDALGVGDPGAKGGYTLRLDNWELEVFNEDIIYARYNDVAYSERVLSQLGDLDTDTSFPPKIERARVANDVSLTTFEVGDTQVFDGDELRMRFLDRQGRPVSGYVNSDCVFIEVVDLDQDEDRYRRERISGYWDGTGDGQNLPFGPWSFAENYGDACGYLDVRVHPVNDLLGDTSISGAGAGQWAKIYVLNPRNGRWMAVDLLETGVGTGTFVSVSCIDLVSQYECAPSLGVLPGDTILAAYQDPSNHSDIAFASIKVSIGGASAPAGSTTRFVDAAGTELAAAVIGKTVFVRVVDPTLAGAGTVQGALTVNGAPADLVPMAGAPAGTFITAGIAVDGPVGATMAATYVDPTNPSDTSTASIPIVSAEFRVDRIYVAPNPFASQMRFAYQGDGLAEAFSVAVYDLAGRILWRAEAHNVLSLEWDGRTSRGDRVANGGYIYVVTISGDGKTYREKGTVFALR